MGGDPAETAAAVRALLPVGGMDNRFIRVTLISCGLAAASGAAGPLAAADAPGSRVAAPPGHAAMVTAYRRLAAVELRIAENRLRDERSLHDLGLSSAAAVDDRRAGVETARRRAEACRRHERYLSGLGDPAGGAAPAAPDDAARALAEARASAVDPYIELAAERLRRLRAAPGAATRAEEAALELDLRRLRCERDILSARPAGDSPPASREAAQRAAEIARHWATCLDAASRPNPDAPPPADAWAEATVSIAEAVDALAKREPFFAGEADWRSLEAAVAVGERRAAKSRQALLVARSRRPDPAGPVEWAVAALDDRVGALAADWRSDRRSLLAARLELADRRASALRRLRREGHASWLERATADADAQSLGRRLAALDAEERLADSRAAVARRIVAGDRRIAAGG